MYDAKVLADSVSPAGVCLITVQATFPRFILAEVNTHRVFSRNSASSRAIPPEKHIERVREHPFVPEVFCERVKGMGQGAPIEDQEVAREDWLQAAAYACTQAELLMEHGISKSHVNRLLEPFLWHTAIISSTAWENFFALRCPEGEEVDLDFPAQPEFQRVAILMRRAMRASSPQPVGPHAWHLPLVSGEDREIARRSRAQDPSWDDGRWLAEVSAGRCARVSFDRQGEYEDPEDSRRRARRLLEAGHLSPFEHPATPSVSGSGNFTGWLQLRGTVPNEANRVGAIEGRAGWEVVPT